jgi:hypothetical protein
LSLELSDKYVLFYAEHPEGSRKSSLFFIRPSGRCVTSVIKFEANGFLVQYPCFREGSMKKKFHQQYVNGVVFCARMVVLISLIVSQFFGAAPQPVLATGDVDVGIVLPTENGRWLLVWQLDLASLTKHGSPPKLSMESWKVELGFPGSTFQVCGNI